MSVFFNERGIASVAALLLLAAASSLALAALAAAKNEADDVRRYAMETRLRFVAEDNAAAFVKHTAAGNLPNNRFVENNVEMLLSDKREGNVRRRIYIKGSTNGITVYSFANAKDKVSGLNMFKQVRFFMERTDDGYGFKHILP